MGGCAAYNGSVFAGGATFVAVRIICFASVIPLSLIACIYMYRVPSEEAASLVGALLPSHVGRTTSPLDMRSAWYVMR